MAVMQAIHIKPEPNEDPPACPVETVFVDNDCMKHESVDQLSSTIDQSEFNFVSVKEERSPSVSSSDAEDELIEPLTVQIKSEGIFTKDGIVDSEKNTKTTINKKYFNTLIKQLDENSWQCVTCKALFVKRKNLVQHVKIHIGAKPYSCKDCSYRCIRKSHLLRHIKTHTGEKPYECKQCQYKCSLRSTLNLHTKIHSEDKPFKCTECNYSAVRRAHLNRHIKTHTDKPLEIIITDHKSPQERTSIKNPNAEVAYKCTECDYITCRRTHLEQHIKIHTGERPYKCKLCNRSFSQKGNLRGHIKTHTGEKPFKCSQCDYKAARKYAVRQHIKAMHSF